MRSGIRVLLVIATLLLGACAPTLRIDSSATFDPQPVRLGVEQPDRYWWRLRFGLTWPEGEAPDLSQHLLIAEQLLLPIIVEHQAQLPLWRFHRRAARDTAGHQFSLIFYSDAATAEQINNEVTAAPLTQWLIDRDMIERTRFTQHSSEDLGRLELTSDPHWPIEIQRSWPYFIMGASQTWLMLVQELSAETPLAGEVDYPALLVHYREVQDRLNEQWRDYGQHAYFHHLSAVFGYQPVMIRMKAPQTF